MLVWWAAQQAWAAPELCNGLDDDEDGLVDEGPVVASVDGDGDGAGRDESFTLHVDCDSLPAGAVSDLSDCDDETEKVRPGLDEGCDARDNDCDGTFDEGACPGEVGTEDTSAWMLAPGTELPWEEAYELCVSLGWHLATPSEEQEQEGLWTYAEPLQSSFWLGLSDRDYEGSWAWVDSSSLDYGNWDYGEPNDYGYGEDCAVMRGNSAWDDRDCEETYAVACETGCTQRYWHLDRDGDGYGDPSDDATDDECERPSGMVANALDCNDDDPHQPAVWYRDGDGDGWGSEAQVGCDLDGVLQGGDCDEDSTTVNPGSEEIAGDGVDQNCDGEDDPVEIDEEPEPSDIDGDGIVDEIDPDPSDPGSVPSKDPPSPEPGCTCQTSPGPSWAALLLMLTGSGCGWLRRGRPLRLP